MNEFLPPIILVSVVGMMLLIPVVMCRRRAAEEIGLTPEYEEICSGKIFGFLWVGIPCIRLSIYENFFVVAFLKPRIFPLGGVRAAQKEWIFGDHLVIVNGAMVFRLFTRNAGEAVRLLQAGMASIVER